MHPALQFSPRISCLPVVHGSGDFAVEVRRVMLSETFDCLAVPLPPSFRQAVEQGISHLPQVTIALQREESPLLPDLEWRPNDDQDDDSDPVFYNYVPIDPCQPIIAGLRIAIQEHLPRVYLDFETDDFEAYEDILPDPYVLKKVPVEQFAAAVLSGTEPPETEQEIRRAIYLGRQLFALEKRYKSILFLCSITMWPWVRQAYQAAAASHAQGESVSPEEWEIDQPEVAETSLLRVNTDNLLFLLGELPFITGLYEQTRFNLDSDENLSVDGVKEMLLAARENYKKELKGRGRKITPHLLQTYLKYVRNLSLIERQMTPDLYTLITAAKQLAGDQFAISLAEVSREYPFQGFLPYGEFQMSIDRGALPDGEIVELKSRLPGPAKQWRTCQLNRKPLKINQDEWAMRWNPYRQCSWPPEDVSIERFRTHLKDKALGIMGNDLARTEKFTTSLMDGLDMRETLRNWHTGNLYVKEMPPNRGTLDCAIMLFDSPADPRDYPWRITWNAEHQDESTLSFFATSPEKELVGPGIALATYGGAMFIFPARPMLDIWMDPQFDFTDTLEERLIAAGCFHSEQRHIALMSSAPPGMGWKRLAKRYGKKLVHVPMSHFSQENLQQLRMFHVLNGQSVRSYAEHFIRKA